MQAIWQPHVTVAALIERDGAFLLVEEETNEGIRLNQPAGHLEANELLTDACAREALEETAWQFAPTALVGIYLWTRPPGETTYLRFAFSGTLGEFDAQRPLDRGILRTLWLSPAEIEANNEQHRSPLVWQCVRDYLAGQRFPLSLLRSYGQTP